ncbi:MAG: family 20 glycosylhydrolase [Clostridia bacterium]|nr:family 20 glycosylhydrolase [Clostridia bacterium]
MFDKRYFLFDFARGRKLDKKEVTDLLDILVNCGYNGICLHLEGFFEMKSFPGAVREGYLKIEEAKWFCTEAHKRSMEVIPIINLVGHAEAFVYFQERFADYRRDNEHFQMNLYDSKLAELSKTIIDEVVEIFNPSYLHIGGDECALDEKEKKLYIKFLSQMCEYVRNKGIKPCIWSDMLFEHKELIDDFTKQVTIFDWWYMGHRPESLELFLDKSFTEIFACPSDQGWDGFIGVQRKSPWPHAMPKDTRNVEADEIEAFLDDAAQLGIKNGLITNWENRCGHNLWSQLSSIARGGLYMIDKEITEQNIEQHLFGKHTPYTKISVILQNLQKILYDAVLQNNLPELLKCRISDAIFNKERLISLITISPKIYGDIKEEFEKGLCEAEKLFENWNADSLTEDRCLRSLFSTLQYGKALFEAIKLGCKGYENYHKAALVQFENQKDFCSLIKEVLRYTEDFEKALRSFASAQITAQTDCGEEDDSYKIINTTDKTKDLISKLNRFIEEEGAPSNDTPVLISWQKLFKETY